MGNFSEVNESTHLFLECDIHPYLFDHQFMGNAVFPAVEAMQILAKSTYEKYPAFESCNIRNAQFLRFLTIDKDQKKIEAYNELQFHSDGNLSSTLVTIHKLRGGTITRKKEHVKIEFSQEQKFVRELLFEEACEIQGDLFEISSEKVYKELVPFLESYHNIIDNLKVSERGAVAKIQAPDYNIEEGPLGSPFPFDAAFHAACVWGQKFTGIVGFPMGFKERQIIKPTKAGEIYMARIFPVEQNKKANLFDIWIYDLHGLLHEIILGVIMSDVSAGKMKVPQWIKQGV